MSQQLINRSSDLKRLRDDGFDIAIVDNYLVLRQVPYVNESKEVKSGTLVSDLTLAGNVTTTPGTHVVFFTGEFPCRWDGTRITQLEHGAQHSQLTKELFVDFSFSHKPATGYTDYHHKMTTYVQVISAHAQKLEPTVTARTYPVIHDTDSDGPFRYLDTASSRADIMMATHKLALRKIAIVGLGGTGSYVLDFVAKTPVEEIHLFDGDVFSQHNAFRAPGAASIDELNAWLSKVAYFRGRYSQMHNGIVAHAYFIDESNAGELQDMDFVFLCLDRGGAKAAIIEILESSGKSFIDVGMGLSLVDNSLVGILRVTTSTVAKREHVRALGRIPFGDGGNDEYAKNIQVADLNALNAVLAVIKWKKLCGFYHDGVKEHHSTFTLDSNMLLNDDTP